MKIVDIPLFVKLCLFILLQIGFRISLQNNNSYISFFPVCVTQPESPFISCSFSQFASLISHYFNGKRVDRFQPRTIDLLSGYFNNDVNIKPLSSRGGHSTVPSLFWAFKDFGDLTRILLSKYPA